MKDDGILWIIEFLKKLRAYPVNSQMGLDQLLRWHDGWMRIDSDITPAKSAEYFFQIEEQQIYPATEFLGELSLQATHLDMLNKTGISAGKPKLYPPPEIPMTDLKKWNRWRKTTIRDFLQNHPDIQFHGQNRGRKYWAKGGRIPLHDSLVARLIREILFNLKRPEKWQGLYEYVQHGMLEFHKNIEENRGINSRKQEVGKQTILIKQDGKGTDLGEFKFDIFNQDISYYQNEYQTDLSDFCENTYTYRWFMKNSSNIQRYMTTDQLVVTGSPTNSLKRGEWCHVEYTPIQSSDTNHPNLYKELFRLYDNINTIKINMNSNDYDVLISMLTSELNKAKKERSDKHD